MTAPIQEPTQDREIQGLGYRTRQLARRPGPPVSNPSGGTGSYPVSHRTEGIYLAPWVSQSQGNNAFGAVVADSTAPFGYYISSLGASQTDAEKGIYFGLGPLGPATGWGVDLLLKSGSSAGRVILEFGTTPVDEQAASISVGYPPPGLGSDKSIADPDFMQNAGASDEFSGWWKADPGYTGIDLYTAGAATWDIYPWYTFSANMFWVAGADGTMLTADGVNPGPYDASIGNSFETGGGDVAWWMRVRANGKNASSSGYGFQMAGFNMYRVNSVINPVAI